MDTIAFIGGGNMAAAILGGLIASGWEPSRITVVDPNADQRDRLASEHGVHTTDEVANAAAADIIVLAVKPQVVSAVATGRKRPSSDAIVTPAAMLRIILPFVQSSGR